MPKFVTIGYGNSDGYARTSIDVRNAAHAHDAALQKNGVVMGRAGEPVQVRNPDATKVNVASGPFMQSALPIAGFAVIEARDISEAIDIVSKVPCAVAHGVVEVWPLQDT